MALGFFMLVWGAQSLEPVLGWRGWMLVVLQFAKPGILIYCSFLLFDADDEIERLRRSNANLEEIAAELQSRLSSVN